MTLNSFFSPLSIALIGASGNPKKLGHQLFKNLLKAKTKVYPVNPKRKTILNKTCFASITDIPHPVDQAVIAIPAKFVPLVAKQAVQKKVNSLVVISAGFSEANSQGKKLELELKNISQKAKLYLLGPNCLGYSNSKINLDLTFAKTPPPKGNIALISQSGAIGSYLFDWASKEKLGFSQFASLGNRAGLNENDLLAHFVRHQDTKVIGIYLESFADGEKFLKTASRLSKSKPIIIMFGGLTKKGKIASQSHTASLSPLPKVISTAITQSGCIPAKNLEEFADLLEIFSLEPPLKDNDLVILTNAGGPAILATDTAQLNNFSLTPLSKKTATLLKNSIPQKIQLNNPIDLLGDAMSDRFQHALTNITKDHTKDAFLIILTPQSMTQLEQTAKVIAAHFKTIKKPVVVSLLGGDITSKAKVILQSHHIATIDFPQKAVNYLNTLHKFYKNKQNRLAYPVRQSKPVKVSALKIRQLTTVLSSGLQSWKNLEKLCKTYKLPLVKTLLLTHKNLDSTIRHLGFPLVLKSDPSESIHRTENKALYLNLNTIKSTKQAFKLLNSKFKTVLAQPQLKTGHELFIGLKRHQGFPPLLTLGSGGIYTEIYQDVSRAFLPVNKKLVKQLLNQTKLGQILSGARGLPPVNFDQAINLILNTSQLMLDFPQIKDIDINPTIISQNSVKIVDIKIKV